MYVSAPTTGAAVHYDVTMRCATSTLWIVAVLLAVWTAPANASCAFLQTVPGTVGYPNLGFSIAVGVTANTSCVTGMYLRSGNLERTCVAVADKSEFNGTRPACVPYNRGLTPTSTFRMLDTAPYAQFGVFVYDRASVNESTDRYMLVMAPDAIQCANFTNQEGSPSEICSIATKVLSDRNSSCVYAYPNNRATNDDGYTVSLWFKVNTSGVATAGRAGNLVSHTTYSAARSFFVDLHTSPDSLPFLVIGWNTTTANATIPEASASAWNLVTASINTVSGTVDLYINATYAASVTDAAVTTFTSFTPNIGCTSTGAGDYPTFYALVTNFSVWDTAMNSTDASERFLSQTLSAPEPGTSAPTPSPTTTAAPTAAPTTREPTPAPTATPTTGGPTTAPTASPTAAATTPVPTEDSSSDDSTAYGIGVRTPKHTVQHSLLLALRVASLRSLEFWARSYSSPQATYATGDTRAIQRRNTRFKKKQNYQRTSKRVKSRVLPVECLHGLQS